MNCTILHLSDLQYGRHHVDFKLARYPLYQDENYDLQLLKLTEDLAILKENGVSINLLVITGDLTETCAPGEYELVEKFLEGLLSFLELKREAVIMVPGNHDVNRNLCKAARLQAEAYNQDFRPPYFSKFEPYKQFFNRFYGKVVWPSSVPPCEFREDKLFVNFYFPDKQILFCGLNSCIDEHEESPHYGNITIDQLRKAAKEINSFDPDIDYLRIAVMHHNFLRGSSCDDENLKDADDLGPLLLDSSFKIVLHGHQHMSREFRYESGGKAFRVLATGAAGLDSESLPDNCRRYAIIQLIDNNIRVYRRKFDGQKIHNSGKGCWVPDMEPTQDSIYFDFELGLKGNTEQPIEEDVFEEESVGLLTPAIK